MERVAALRLKVCRLLTAEGVMEPWWSPEWQSYLLVGESQGETREIDWLATAVS